MVVAGIVFALTSWLLAAHPRRDDRRHQPDRQRGRAVPRRRAGGAQPGRRPTRAGPRRSPGTTSPATWRPRSGRWRAGSLSGALSPARHAPRRRLPGDRRRLRARRAVRWPSLFARARPARSRRRRASARPATIRRRLGLGRSRRRRRSGCRRCSRSTPSPAGSSPQSLDGLLVPPAVRASSRRLLGLIFFGANLLAAVSAPVGGAARGAGSGSSTRWSSRTCRRTSC